MNVIAGKCNDARLCVDCLRFTMACQNFAVQIKIMCAVKAASSAEEQRKDTAIEDQLVGAATGLANAIISTAKACTSASVHKSVRSAK